MFIFDPLTQGLELLSQRELQRAEFLFLSVINDPYAEGDDSQLARKYLNDIRSCQSGSKSLNFERYKSLAKHKSQSLDSVIILLRDLYFSSCKTYGEIDEELSLKIPEVIGCLKRIKIRDIIARDELFKAVDKKCTKLIHNYIKENNQNKNSKVSLTFEVYRWKTIYRKFIELVNPILLERHLELIDYILETNEIQLLDDPKLNALTPKYRWILESTLRSKWYLLRSYFFKAKSEIQEQFLKKEGTRKYWEEVKFKKIRIFEDCGFHERNIQKFLFSDKLNYKTLEEIYEFAKSFNLLLVPRDVSLALRGVKKAKDHIKERGGFLIGDRKEFQNRLLDLGFSRENSYQIAKQAKRANGHQIVESFAKSLDVAGNEIFWYRVPPSSDFLKKEIETQCIKHLSTVRIHLFDRGRLNKILLQAGKPLIKKFLIRTYGEDVVSLHCYFRLETIHQYYKLKLFQYHAERIPSVSELIKISRKDFAPIVIESYRSFIKKKRLTIPPEVWNKIKVGKSVTEWEDSFTTKEEKFLLKAWFLMDHGVSVTQGLINKGVFNDSFDFLKFAKIQGLECNS